MWQIARNEYTGHVGSVYYFRSLNTWSVIAVSSTKTSKACLYILRLTHAASFRQVKQVPLVLTGSHVMDFVNIKVIVIDIVTTHITVVSLAYYRLHDLWHTHSLALKIASSSVGGFLISTQSKGNSCWTGLTMIFESY